jgi:hypothetical protein
LASDNGCPFLDLQLLRVVFPLLTHAEKRAWNPAQRPLNILGAYFASRIDWIFAIPANAHFSSWVDPVEPPTPIAPTV